MVWELYQNDAEETATTLPTEQLQKRVGEKQFIINPINNALREARKASNKDRASGSHWTIMVIDYHQSTIHTRHYDSKKSDSMGEEFCSCQGSASGFWQTLCSSTTGLQFQPGDTRG
jgi:hypothetical protein